jgi:hypothetical protein
MTKAQQALALAQSIPETAENWSVLRELVHALADIAALAEKVLP